MARGPRQPRERPQTEEELGFDTREMVPWLRPQLLIKAAREVVVSDLFARFVDKREIEAGLPPEPVEPKRKLFGRTPNKVQPYTHGDYRDVDGALWFDYVSDVGEGFDPTYTVAWLLAQGSLPASNSHGAAILPRGRFLILGGDQAYPAASWEEYQNRFIGPYKAALPFADEDEAPHLYAIPGNHDWYDGLTAFMRLFCQEGWVGGWRTRQKRSYFARRLSERWWLWATDIQFDTYIDGPQLDYFRQVAGDDEFDEHSRVILVTAKPSWTGAEPEEHPELKKEGSWEALRFFEEQLIESAGAKVGVTISGDKHHYSRYSRVGTGHPRERITAGGGGAHTSATHGLPREVDLRPDGSDEPVTYKRGTCSPDIPTSERMRRQGILRIFTEGQLGLFVGVIYGVLAILLANGIKDLNTDLAGNLASGRSASNLFRDGLNFWWVAIVVVLIIALWKFAKLPRSRTGPLRPLSKGAKGFLFGFAHALAHVLAATTLAIGFLLLFYELDPGLAETGLKIGWISALATAVAGYVVGLSIFGLYLLLANLEDPRQHATEIFGGLASTDWKNFLRLRLDTDEKLTIFPIGVPKSPTWELKPEGTDYEPWFTPENGQSVDYALLEAPIEIEPDQQ